MKRRSSVEEWGNTTEIGGNKHKKQKDDDDDRPLSLLHLCMRQATMHLPHYAHKLRMLPTDLSLTLLHDFLRKRHVSPYFSELRILCRNSSWSSHTLSLCGVPRLNSRGAQWLSILPHLTQLDLRGCQWLDNLNFLPGMLGTTSISI